MLSRFAELLATSPHNLLSTGDRPRAGDHVAEAVAVAGHLSPRPGTRWLDLGTGGGLPGLVLAVVFPDVAWTLVDATRKKVAAVEAFAGELGVRNIEAITARAEELANTQEHRGVYAGVVARAVAALPTLLELSRGFLAPDGEMVAIKGPAWPQELAASEEAMRVLRFADPDHVVVETAVRPTTIVTMRAVGPPPDGYPRRSGLPRTQPLGIPRS